MGPAISGNMSIKKKHFETSYILFEETEEESSAQKLVLKNIPSISNEEFVLGAVIKEYNSDLTEKATYYTIERQIVEDLFENDINRKESNLSKESIYEENKKNDKIINGFDALSMVVPSEGSKLNKKYIEKIKNYADENQIELEDLFENDVERKEGRLSKERIYEENKNNDKIINGFDALSMVVPSEGSKLNKKYIEKIKNYADENQIELENYILTHEINTTAYADKQHEYKEIYIKIKQR